MQEENLTEKPRRRELALPLSIVIAALLISGSWIYSAGVKQINSEASQQAANSLGNVQNPSANVAPVSSKDHVRGSADAKVKIIEFSDLECPFCKQFHGTMKQIMAEYGTRGEVAWVYRHFPLDSIHSKARQSAIAAECAGKIGGSDGYWKYLDKYFEVTPSNNLIELSQLPQIATSVGLDRTQFDTCLASGEFAQKIEEQLQDAIKAGGRGTPYSVVVNASGKAFPISGALPYVQVKDIIEQALR